MIAPAQRRKAKRLKDLFGVTPLLFRKSVRTPLIWAYGGGLDSTAGIIECVKRGIAIDAIVHADVGRWCEKLSTPDYVRLFSDWLTERGAPAITVVRYQVGNFKHWPPYHSLLENCLTNATYPGILTGASTCSQKWKHAAQMRWALDWEPALEAWANGVKARKAIGYEAGEKRRYCDAESLDNASARYERALFEFWYPLIEWGMDRDDCARTITAAGLPVPEKSSCFFCPEMKPWEVDALPKCQLRMIVILEARFLPRIRNRKRIGGLWRAGCKGMRGSIKRPPSMTEYIIEQGLLPKEEVERLQQEVPDKLMQRNELHAQGKPVESWDEFFRKVGVFDD